MLTIKEAEDLVQEAFKVGMLQSGIEARDFALWISERGDIGNVLELGTCAGGLLFLMDRAANPGLRISMDMPWDNRDPNCYGLEPRFKAQMPNVIEVLGQIHDKAQRDRLAAALGDKKIDLMMIDADHSYEGCKRHVDMYAPFIRPGGYIAFHDCSNGWACGLYVKQELFPEHEHWLFEEPKNLFGIGVIQL